MNGKETLQLKRTEIKRRHEVVYGVIFPRLFNNFAELKIQLANLASKLNKDQVLKILADDYLFFTNLMLELGIVSEEMSINIENGNLLFFHSTDDSEKLRVALKKDNLTDHPGGNNLSWSMRCFGSGLTGFSDKRKVLPGHCFELSVPVDKTAIVVKQALWRMYLEHIFLDIKKDKKLDAELVLVLKAIKNEENTRFLIESMKNNEAFNITSIAIDIYCLLNKKATRLSCRKDIQGKYIDAEGKLAENFGYRTYCDERFGNTNYLLGVMDFLMKENNIDTNTRGDWLKKIETVLTRTKKERSGIVNRNVVTGWDGEVNTDEKATTLQILFNIFSGHNSFKFLQKLGVYEKVPNLLKLASGWYPINEMDILPGHDLIFGTDFASNNVLVLRHFDSKTMKTN